MDSKQLQTFILAADTLNFTKTAQLLNFAQSSVTAQMKALEAELETPLFERLGKRLVLTEAGRKFQQYANQMVTLQEEAKTALRGGTAFFGKLTIGAQESQCTYRLPMVLLEFKKQYPHMEIVFKPAHSNERARRHLTEGVLDFAFIMDEAKPHDMITIEPLIQEQIKIVTAPNHPIQKRKKFSVQDLEKETFLLTEEGCSYRTLLEDAFAEAKIHPLNKFEFGSIEAIKQCVMIGIGIAVLPDMAVRKELEAGKMKEIPWHPHLAPIFTHIAWHKDKVMTPPLQAFIDLTRSAFKENKMGTI